LNGMQNKLNTLKNVRFLDIGCGYGYSTLAFAFLVCEING